MKAGAACSSIHGLTYSLIATQAAYLATYFPSVYWNTAYLRTMCGLEDDETTDYKKMSKGVGNILSWGIEVLPVNINESGVEFEPDEKRDAIRFGLKALTGVNPEASAQIIANRPYTSLTDFMERTPLPKPAMISLIKSGAFECFADRRDTMKEYLMAVTDTKKRVTMQNFNALVERDLLPESLSFQKRLFAFNKALKAYKRGDGFVLSDPAFYGFYERNFDIDLLEQTADGPYLPQKAWKKAYDKAMQPAKDYIVANNARMLDSLNRSILRDEWVKYALGNASSWEMDSMGYYYHTHELAYVDKRVYGIDEFKDMQDCSATQRTVRGRPVYELTRIAGTVIAKDDLKCLVTLVTPESGVVDVKFYKSTYADYNRQLSEVLPDGTKRVIEKPWFTRGTKLIVTGFKRSDTFVAKVYKNSGPMVFKVLRTFTDGTVEMVGARANEVEND